MPLRGREHEMQFQMRNANGALLTPPAGLEATVVVRGRARPGRAPRVLDATTGVCSLRLPADVMDAEVVMVTVTSSSPNAVAYTERIIPERATADTLASRVRGWR